MSEDDDIRKEAQQALLKRITEQAPTATGETLLRLAEAYAWLRFPNQPHGGGAVGGS
jgi:hypothetical protein